jgi:hypothetical protein
MVLWRCETDHCLLQRNTFRWLLQHQCLQAISWCVLLLVYAMQAPAVPAAVS